jgi:hypothetical protein
VRPGGGAVCRRSGRWFDDRRHFYESTLIAARV